MFNEGDDGKLMFEAMWRFMLTEQIEPVYSVQPVLPATIHTKKSQHGQHSLSGMDGVVTRIAGYSRACWAWTIKVHKKRRKVVVNESVFIMKRLWLENAGQLSDG